MNTDGLTAIFFVICLVFHLKSATQMHVLHTCVLNFILQAPVRVHSASFDSIDHRLKLSETSVDGDETDGSKKKKKKKLFFFKKNKSKAIS